MQMDQRTLRHAGDLYESLRSVRTDQRIAFGIWRDGNFKTLEVRALELPTDHAIPLAESVLGMLLRPNDGAGFVVESVRRNAAVARIGFQQGDIVIGVGGRPLTSLESLRNAVAPLRWLGSTQVVVVRGQNRYRVVVPLR